MGKKHTWSTSNIGTGPMTPQRSARTSKADNPFYWDCDCMVGNGGPFEQHIPTIPLLEYTAPSLPVSGLTHGKNKVFNWSSSLQDRSCDSAPPNLRACRFGSLKYMLQVKQAAEQACSTFTSNVGWLNKPLVLSCWLVHCCCCQCAFCAFLSPIGRQSNPMVTKASIPRGRGMLPPNFF